jgi:hypothetical protein
MSEPQADRQPEECNSCSYETAALTRYDSMKTGGEPRWLCQLCAGTLAANALEYPHHFTDGGVILQTICYIGNAILDAIRKAGAGE